MKIKGNFLARTGDHFAYEAWIYENNEPKCSLLGKLTRTEMAIGVNRGVVKTEQEALEVFKHAVEKTAKEMYVNGSFSQSEKYEKFFSLA
jgi:hypothetical protein